MSDIEVEPDPIIRTALQRLPIPSHADDFWTRVHRAIDAEGGVRPAEGSVLVAAPVPTAAPDDEAGGGVQALEPDPALALVPKALRRTSNGVLLAVAAAAAVVVTLAGTTLLDDRDSTEEVATSELNQPAASLDALVDEAHPDDATPAALSEEGADASSDAVLAWVEDLGTGDGAAAWQAMGTASQAHFGSQDAFEAEMSALAEGYGAWSAAAPDDVLVTPVQSDDDGTIAVVTLVGTVAQEGTTVRRAEAFPVRIADGEAVLEPFAFAGVIELVVPEVTTAAGEPTPVEPDEALVMVVPGDALAPILRVDDGDPIVCGEAEGTELTDLEGTSGQRCSYLAPGGLEPGEHTLTMAFLGPDGTSISAESTLFDAA